MSPLEGPSFALPGVTIPNPRYFSPAAPRGLLCGLITFLFVFLLFVRTGFVLYSLFSVESI